jgi:hypothetical protein
MLYPVPPEIPKSYDAILSILSSAQKYDMVAVESSIRAEVSRRAMAQVTAPSRGIPYVCDRMQQKAFSRNGDHSSPYTRLPANFRESWWGIAFFSKAGLCVTLLDFRTHCSSNLYSQSMPFLDRA